MVPSSTSNSLTQWADPRRKKNEHDIARRSGKILAEVTVETRYQLHFFTNLLTD